MGGSSGAIEPPSETKKCFEAIVVWRGLNLVSFFGVFGRKRTPPPEHVRIEKKSRRDPVVVC